MATQEATADSFSQGKESDRAPLTLALALASRSQPKLTPGLQLGLFYEGIGVGTGGLEHSPSLVIGSLETLSQVTRLWRPDRGSLAGHSFSMPMAAQPQGPENWAHTPTHTQNTHFHLPTLSKYTPYYPYTNAHTQYNPQAYKLTQKHKAAPHTYIASAHPPAASSPRPY